MDIDEKPIQQIEEFEEIDTAENKPKLELKENVSLLDRGKGIHTNNNNNKKRVSTSSPSSSIRNNMTRDQIKYCGAIMRNLKKHRDAAPFLHPVDYIKLNVPDYPKIIQHPMDLNTVDKKLNSGDYGNVQDFISDIRLVFNNCFKFNGPEAMISMLCQNVESAFEKSLRQMPASRGTSPMIEQQAEADSLYSPVQENNKNKKRKKSVNNNVEEPELPPLDTKRRRKNDLQMKYCMQTIRELKKSKYRDINYPFLQPVDVIALNIPDYVNIVKHPMDLATIERKLSEGDYHDIHHFEVDIRLMFNNCYLYNPPHLPVHKMGKELEKVFDEKWAQIPDTPLPTPIVDHREDEYFEDSYTVKHKSRSERVKREDDDEEEEDDDDDDRDKKIAELERHILTISKQIDAIKSQKKKPVAKPVLKEKKPIKEKRKRLTKKKASSPPPPPPKPKTPKSLDELPEFTFDQKKDLSDRINNLSGDALNTVVNIIQSSMPNLDGQGQEEIVLDIDSLDRSTLHRLHEFVTGESLVSKKSSSPSAKKPRTSHNDSSSESDSDSSSGSDSDDSGSSSD